MFPLTCLNSAGAAPDSSVLLLDPRSAVSSDVLPHLVGLCGCICSSDWLQASGASSSIRAENAVAGPDLYAARCERAPLNQLVWPERWLLVLTDPKVFLCLVSVYSHRNEALMVHSARPHTIVLLSAEMVQHSAKAEKFLSPQSLAG